MRHEARSSVMAAPACCLAVPARFRADSRRRDGSTQGFLLTGLVSLLPLLPGCAVRASEPLTPGAETSGTNRKARATSRVAPELFTLYEGWNRSVAPAEKPESGIAIRSPLSVRDGFVLIDCAANGDPTLLSAALSDLGMTGTTVFQRVVSGWLPIAAIGRLAELEGLALARPATAQIH